jgi:hypothetical protein
MTFSHDTTLIGKPCEVEVAHDGSDYYLDSIIVYVTADTREIGVKVDPDDISASDYERIITEVERNPYVPEYESADNAAKDRC